MPFFADSITVRRRGHYIIHVYLPTTACVVVSWITFYIKLDVAPARVGLAVTTLLNTDENLLKNVQKKIVYFGYILTLALYLKFVIQFLTIVSINYGLNRGFPPVSYPKAIDIWNFVCFFFIFCSLLEFAVASVR